MKNSVLALLCVVSLALQSCRSIGEPEVKRIPLPEYSNDALREYLSSLALDEIFVERMTMTAPPKGELLPPAQSFGTRNDTGELERAQCKVLVDLAEDSPDNGMRQVAYALLQQEAILQVIYMASSFVISKEVNANHGILLANAGVALREFRKEHPELPGVLAERVLSEMSPWLDIFPEWDVIYSLDPLTILTDSPEMPEDLSVPSGLFVRNPDARQESPAEERPRWFHWKFGGQRGDMELGLYLPVLPEGTEVIANGEKVELEVGEPTLLEMSADEKADEDFDVHLALRLPDKCRDFQAKFPILFVGRFTEAEEDQ